jgi:hypothetical protein
LDVAIPVQTNLARDIVRSLRVNYSQLGNYDGVNKASSIEAKLTGDHLFNAAWGRGEYYSNKYTGWQRVGFAISHANWLALDILWGNGENPWRIASSALIILLAGWWWNYHLYVPKINKSTFFDKFWLEVFHPLKEVLAVFWGVPGAPRVDIFLGIMLVVLRLFLFALFSAVLVKRLSRR